MLLEDHASAFIVRIWLEHREVEAASVEWRGSIEHVTSGSVKYLTDLNEVTRFIGSFLEANGVQISISGQIVMDRDCDWRCIDRPFKRKYDLLRMQ